MDTGCSRRSLFLFAWSTALSRTNGRTPKKCHESTFCHALRSLELLSQWAVGSVSFTVVALAPVFRFTRSVLSWEHVVVRGVCVSSCVSSCAVCPPVLCVLQCCVSSSAVCLPVWCVLLCVLRPASCVLRLVVCVVFVVCGVR